MADNRTIDGPESLLYPGEPRWRYQPITYNFMPNLPEVYAVGRENAFTIFYNEDEIKGRNFVSFNSNQEQAAKDALQLWADVANFEIKQVPNKAFELGDVLDLGVIKFIAEKVGLWDWLNGRLNDAFNTVFKAFGLPSIFPLVEGADIRFGTADLGSLVGGSTSPPRNDIWARFNEARIKLLDEIDSVLEPIRSARDFANAATGIGIFIDVLPRVPRASEILRIPRIKLDMAGDIWINNTDYPTNSPPTYAGTDNTSKDIDRRGQHGFQTLVHEIGHALGIKHPGNYNASGGGAPGPFLPTTKDNFRYSVMSYKDVGSDHTFTDPTTGVQRYIYPETPMLYDVAAIQELYGVNLNTSSGDNEYSWDHPFVVTIWDAGGHDKIDASKSEAWLSGKGVKIDLNASSKIDANAGNLATQDFHFSSIGLVDNLAIAYGVTVEDAIGASGDDILIGNSVDNALTGGTGNDTLTGGVGADTLIGGDGFDTASYKDSDIGVYVSLTTGKGSSGDAEGDTLETIENLEGSDKGGDLLIGNPGDNDLNGLGGSDRLFGEAGGDTLHGGNENDELYGGNGDDTLYGDANDDLLAGGTGNDFIDGGGGVNDTVSYEDTFVAFEPPYGVTVNIDEVSPYQTPGRYIYSDTSSNTVIGFEPTVGDRITAGTAIDGLGNQDILKNLENIIGSGLDDVLIGNSVDNKIQGLAGNDIFIGNAGNDRFEGGDGIDTVSYRYDPKGISVDLGQGTATDGFGETDTLDNIENIQGSGKSDRIIGSTQDNWLLGGDGNDTLTGGAGADTLIGETGNDTASYAVSDAGVSVNLTTGKGSGGDAEGDTLRAIENLEGSSRNDTLTGDTADNRLNGRGGADTLSGDAGRDTLSGGDGNDALSGDLGDDSLYGENGNDTLDGGAGDDLMIGGKGNDVYVVDQIADQITELVNQGRDTVKSSITYRLGDNLENLILTGKESINGMGNNLDNIILGNDAGNFLFGDAGKDILSGGDGDDTLDGGVKSDVMAGGLGNDTYIVDSSNDQTIENENEGIDKVNASVSYVLSSNVENLNLVESNAINGTGNSLGNIINGNNAVNNIYAGDGADLIDGAGGDDYIYGESGNDSIVGGNGDDNLNGGLGDDVISGNKGQDWVVGDLGNDVLIGGSGDDHLIGSMGDDVLIGGTGKDWLTGGMGADQFTFRSRKDASDIITDFRISDGDRIAISAKGFGKNLKVGTLSADQFTLGSKAQGVSDRFIYDSATGHLFFDKDGTGSANQTQIATLSKGLSLTSRDFSIA